ncbi:MAG: DUF1501 domain-containing protein, partial [Chloroherpetonaceae bacterium]|nr:DUF1501 domain-containing protein [Chloroherpetonaceae bacterium]
MFRLEMPRPAYARSGPTRRDFLQVGTLCGLGLSLPGYLRLQAQGRVSVDRDVHGILLLLTGAPGHLDTWDPKPDAPPEIRGPFRPIRTAVPGVWISEIFPRMARRANHFAILRSVHRPPADAPVPGHLHPLPGDCTTDPPIATVTVPPEMRLQEAIDRMARALEESPSVVQGDAALREACAHLTAPQARAAFDLSQEPEAVRDRYGRN